MCGQLWRRSARRVVLCRGMGILIAYRKRIIGKVELQPASLAGCICRCCFDAAPFSFCLLASKTTGAVRLVSTTLVGARRRRRVRNKVAKRREIIVIRHVDWWHAISSPKYAARPEMRGDVVDRNLLVIIPRKLCFKKITQPKMSAVAKKKLVVCGGNGFLGNYISIGFHVNLL